jgi:hypothetical protein
LQSAARAVGGEIFNQLLGGLNAIAGAAGGINNGISPTPSSAMADCIIPRLNPRRPAEPDEDPHPIRGRPAGGWGDPHLISHDGLGFDFQGGGDYAYIESDTLILQTRQIVIGASSDVSRIEAIAIRFGETTVVLNDPIDPSRIGSESGLQDLITVNGTDLPIGLGGWIDLDTQGSFAMRFKRYTYVYIVGTLQMIMRHGGGVVELVLDESLRANVKGVLGNFDGDPTNDLQTTAGTAFTADDTDTLNGAFRQSWLREGNASLFNSPYDPNVNGAIMPANVPTLSDVAPSVRQAAADRCAEAGVTHGYTQYGCVYDMVFDTDDRWLDDAVDIAERGPNIVPAAALASPEAEPILIGIDARVSPDVPAPGAGNIALPNEVDRYTITIPAFTTRVLRPREPCLGVQAFGVLVDSATAAPVEYSLSCGTSVPLPTGESTLSVFSHSGDTGVYSFDVVDLAVVDLGTVALDTLIDGNVAADNRLDATIPGNAGDRVFITTQRNDNCGRQWEIVDANGAVIKRTSVCLDLGLHALANPVPYRLRILPGPGVGYAFNVLSVDADTTDIVGDETQFDLTVTTPGQRASATFPVTQGERIYIDRAGGVASGTLILSAPDGSEVARTGASQEDLQITANSSGDYTLTLDPRNDFTGVVSITLIRVASDTDITVNKGQRFTLTISTFGQTATASIDLSAGETLTVSRVSTDVQSGIAAIPAVESPGGTDRFLIIGSRTITASVGGAYQIVLRSSEQDGFIGTMTFEVN